MAKKQRTSQRRRPASTPSTKESSNNDACISVIDAVAEIVHQGFGRLFDATELRVALEEWQPHCSMNYEYVFAWKPDFARRKSVRQTAEQCLEAGTDCKWVDLSFVTDSQGRDVFVLEIGDAAASEDEDVGAIIDRLEEIWQWKSQPLTIAGPFASSDEAEAWMAENGAFREVD